MSDHTVEHPTSLKVIGLGLGRTGTFSLREALEILGFGPCHHPLIKAESDGWRKFAEVVREKKDGATPEKLGDLYRGYASAVDSTAALLAEPLYKAYPDAKFILTVRDPAKWAQSVQTVFVSGYKRFIGIQQRCAMGTATKAERRISQRLDEIGIVEWTRLHLDGYHGGRLETDPEGEFARHNEFIKQLIPHEKLLVFDVGEGWKPLVDFLGVPEPEVPFPRTNDTQEFLDKTNKGLQQFIDEGGDADQ